MQSRGPRFEFTAEMSFSLSLISIVHLIKKMSECVRWKIGKKVIFFSLCDKTLAPLCVRRCRGAFQKEMKTSRGGGRGGRITCISSELLLVTQRGPAALTPTQPHTRNRIVTTSIWVSVTTARGWGTVWWRRIGSHQFTSSMKRPSLT